MLKFSVKYLLYSTVLLGIILATAPKTAAQQTQEINQPLPQKSPTYGCVSGYPDGTFQGNQPVSRYEFAAVLNACLNQINRLIESAPADGVTRKDLAVPLSQLEQYQQELNNLDNRLDRLDPESQ